MDIFYFFINEFVNKHSKREIEYKAGRYLVEYAAKNFFNIKNSELEVVNNKPRFKYSNIHFSISHSNNIIAVCFDKHPVGFDIEFIRPRNFAAIAKRMKFDIKENSIQEFYKCWTRYEAEYKLQEKPKKVITKIFKEKYMLTAALGI